MGTNCTFDLVVYNYLEVNVNICDVEARVGAVHGWTGYSLIDSRLVSATMDTMPGLNIPHNKYLFPFYVPAETDNASLKQFLHVVAFHRKALEGSIDEEGTISDILNFDLLTNLT